MTFKRILKLLSLTFGIAILANQQLVNAQEVWKPRSAADIMNDLKSLEDGNKRYTVKWGDTLYAISLATNVSIEQLAKINHIENIRLIEVGTTMYFDESLTVVTIANEDTKEVTSYDLNSGQETNTPEIVTKDLEDTTEIKIESTIEEDKPTEINTYTTVNQEETTTMTSVTTSAMYSLDYFMFHGVIYWNGYMFTYYSQSVLPGGGLSIPGRHVNELGYVADGDGYIVLANDAPLGTIIDTPFGAKGKVYDRGTSGNHFDVYIR